MFSKEILRMDSLGIRGRILSVSLLVGAVVAPVAATHPGDGDLFRRIASFPVFLNTSGCGDRRRDRRSRGHGNLLVYTDSRDREHRLRRHHRSRESERRRRGRGRRRADLGRGLGQLRAGRREHQRRLRQHLRRPRGDRRRTAGPIVRTIPLGGQPDSIAVSPDGRYAAIAIENERDEDLGRRRAAAAPPGFVVIVDLVGPPANWTTRIVDLVGVPRPLPGGSRARVRRHQRANIAVVTLQENNHIVLIRLRERHR